MGTTHVVSNALAAPDPRAKALQRVDVRAGRWLINGVINGGDSLAEGAARLGSARLGSARLGSARLGYGQGDIAVEALVGTAFQARPNQMKDAPVFIPHTRPERGPSWFAEPRTALLSAVPDPATPAAARGIVEGVLFADRMIIESCIGAQQRTLYASGAFGYEPELPQLLADALDRDILVVDESHLLPSALQQCASTSSRARRCRHRRLASCARVQNGGTSSRHAGSTAGRSGRR